MQTDYDTLTRRIVAIDLDISREMDSDRRAVLKAKRDDLAREREKIASDIAVLHPGYPLSVVADASQLEGRVSNLERDIKHIWQVLRPGPRLVFARAAFWALLVCVIVLWVKQESFAWMVTHPAQGIIITAAIVIAALIIRWLPEDDHDDQW